jgi:hypothetical protein
MLLYDLALAFQFSIVPIFLDNSYCTASCTMCAMALRTGGTRSIVLTWADSTLWQKSDRGSAAVQGGPPY